MMLAGPSPTALLNVQKEAAGSTSQPTPGRYEAEKMTSEIRPFRAKRYKNMENASAALAELVLPSRIGYDRRFG